MISLEQGVQLIWQAFEEMKGGEIFVKKIPSMNILDIAKSVNENAQTVEIGIRPGEKLHEQMIGLEDAHYTYEYDEFYKILPSINDWANDPDRIGEGKRVDPNFHYSSDTNSDWMSISELKQWIDANFGSIGKI